MDADLALVGVSVRPEEMAAYLLRQVESIAVQLAELELNAATAGISAELVRRAVLEKAAKAAVLMRAVLADAGHVMPAVEPGARDSNFSAN